MANCRLVAGSPSAPLLQKPLVPQIHMYNACRMSREAPHCLSSIGVGSSLLMMKPERRRTRRGEEGPVWCVLELKSPASWRSLSERENRTRCHAVHAAAAGAAVPHAFVTGWLFALCTVYVGALALLMVLLPRWQQTQKMIHSLHSFMPLGIAYGVLLAWSWQPDTFSLILPGSLTEGLKGGWNPQFFPSIAGVSTLFSRPVTAASLWVHILAINLFLAREVFFDGLRNSICTRHSVLLSAVMGPLGLLSHWLTVFLTRRFRKSSVVTEFDELEGFS